MNFKEYKTIIFDCDGVILNSNNVKTEAFREALSSYEEDLVNEFIAYHKLNGGISRYEKIKFFLKNLAPKYNYTNEIVNYNLLIKRFSSICTEALYKVEVAEGLKRLRDHNSFSKWLVISGGDQLELRDVFDFKGIYDYFNGGIFGSPDKKFDILNREIENNNIEFPALFLGDSKLDYQVANSHSIKFIFISQWTDLYEYRKFCEDNNITLVENISYLYDLEF